MINVLYIALEFAPVQTTGAYRSIDFARYLPDFGIMPHVLTVKPEDGERIFSTVSNAHLLEKLSPELSITYLVDQRPIDPTHESKWQRSIRMYSSLDDTFYRRFNQSLKHVLTAALSSRRFDAVIASAPPFGATHLGMAASKLLQCPLILDMRDSWADFEYAPSTTLLHYHAKRLAERSAFGAADKIVTVTERLANVFRSSHEHVPFERFDVIANGFDGDAFEQLEITCLANQPVFNIAYVGSYYYNPEEPVSLRHPHRLLHYSSGKEDWSYRGPQYFFRAWSRLISSNPEVGKRIRFHHIGKIPPFLDAMTKQYGVQQYCKAWGFVPKHQVGKLLDDMQALLATSMKRMDGGDYCLASKTFDYIMAKKTVLAFVCDGSQRDFLERAGIAIICDPDDATASAVKMEQLIINGAVHTLNADYVNQFHRREAANRLASVINEVTGQINLKNAGNRLRDEIPFI
jgi:hypothetical protein